MAGFEAGGGAGVAALGPLQAMWRAVYQKAAAAAEARVRELLRGHEYHLHQTQALVFTIDGGGGLLEATGEGLVGPAAELPRPVEVLRWAVHADAVGSATFDLRLANPGAEPPVGYPPTGDDSAVGEGLPPTLSGNTWATSEALLGDGPQLPGWTTRWPRGAVVVPVLTTATGVSRLTLTLRVRAL